MNPDHLLEVLARTGAHIGRTRHGQTVTLGLPDTLHHALAQHGVDLALAIGGRATGHRFVTCPSCGRDQLVASAHNCHMTPRCPGKVPARMKDPQPRLEGLECVRPGCGRPAHHLTHTHEPVCHLDFLHLALITPQESTAP